MTDSARPARAPEARLIDRGPGARLRLAVAIACGFAAAALVLVAAYLIAGVVASVFLDGASAADVAVPLVAIALVAVVRAPLLLAADAFAQDASSRVRGGLRADLTGHLLALGPAYTTRERTGELAGVALEGLDAVDAYITSFQPARALAVAVPLLVVAMMLVIDPPTTLVLIFTGPILVLLLAYIGGRTRAITARRFAEVRWLGAFFLDMLGGLATLKMFGRSREQVETIRTISRQYADTTMEVLRTAFQTSLVLEWGGAVAVALVAVEVSLRLMDGAIAFDRALAVLIIVPEFFLPLRQLATRYHSGAAGRAVATRAFAILDEPLPARHHVEVGPDAGVGVAGAGVGVPVVAPDGAPSGLAVTFRDVSFTYPGRIEPAVGALDLAIGAGRLTALVGVSGAGKSTIASLLLRFIEPDSGHVLVGDTDLAAIGLGAWRAQVAWVSQLPHLFHGSVADNIRLARPGATDGAVRAAAREAGADDFIAALPHGYDQAVGESGVRLSGGQRQRIAIARAILADARLVILDEATSHLDTASETVIRDTIRRMAGPRTVLVVSHRLRLAAVADEVAVIDAGRVIESGPPADLARREGAYRRLLDVRQTDAEASPEAGP